MKQFTSFFPDKTGYRFYTYPFILLDPCCCWITQLCLTLCDPMDCSMANFPVLQHFPELAQTHVHWVGDAIQQSHPLSSPSPPALNPSQYQGLFKWVSSLHQVAKVLELQLQHQSFHWNHDTILICFLNVTIWVASHVSKLFVHNIIINTGNSFFLLLYRTLQKTILFRNLWRTSLSMFWSCIPKREIARSKVVKCIYRFWHVLSNESLF